MPLASFEAAPAPVGEALLDVMPEPTGADELEELVVADGVGDLLPGLDSLAEEPWPVGDMLLAVGAEPIAPVEPIEPDEFIEEPLVPMLDEPVALAAPFGTRLPWVASPWADVDELPLLAAGLPGLVLVVALVVDDLVPLLIVVVSAVGDFLLLFMSPSASAEPLAKATIDVRINAGASLRIWNSNV